MIIIEHESGSVTPRIIFGYRIRIRLSNMLSLDIKRTGFFMFISKFTIYKMGQDFFDIQYIYHHSLPGSVEVRDGLRDPVHGNGGSPSSGNLRYYITSCMQKLSESIAD